MPSKGSEQDNHQATSWRAKMVARQVALQPASASEKSLKVNIYRIAQSQLLNPLTTCGSMYELIRT
jgi:hypothetical protein